MTETNIRRVCPESLKDIFTFDKPNAEYKAGDKVIGKKVVRGVEIGEMRKATVVSGISERLFPGSSETRYLPRIKMVTLGTGEKAVFRVHRRDIEPSLA